MQNRKNSKKVPGGEPREENAPAERNEAVEEKRERRWAILQLLEEDHLRLRRLGIESGYADRYAALVGLVPFVREMKEDNLIKPPERRPLKLGIPPELDEAIKAKANELGVTSIKVLLSAAQLQIDKWMVHRKRRNLSKSAKTPRNKKATSSSNDAKTSNGVLAEDGAGE